MAARAVQTRQRYLSDEAAAQLQTSPRSTMTHAEAAGLTGLPGHRLEVCATARQ
jgi:hypothetical protein